MHSFPAFPRDVWRRRGLSGRRLSRSEVAPATWFETLRGVAALLALALVLVYAVELAARLSGS